jgi:glycogen synthase
MRVLLQADAVGGVFTYALELARALSAGGAEVVLATEGAPLADDQAAAVAALPRVAHHGAAFRLEWMDDPWDDVARAGAWLLELERRTRPDVVHLNAFAHGALPFRAPRLVVGHSCVASWFEAVRGAPAGPAWDRYRRAVRAGLAGATAVAAPSVAMARALRRHHGARRVAVIPNGRDAARFPPGEKQPLVMGAGRLWDEAKNAAALAGVAEEVGWGVVIAGETARPTSNATSTSTEVPLAPSVGPAQPARRRGAPRTFPGHRPAVLLGRLPEPALAAWLARAAVFAHPARYEPFGLAVLEAALAGCALVLGDLASLRETWDGAALFVPPDDRAALAAALDLLAGDEGGRAGLAAAARTRALALSPGRMAAAYLDLYRRMGAPAPELHP